MNSLFSYRTVGFLTRLMSRRAAYAIAEPVSAWAYKRNHGVREALAANLRVVLNGRGKAWTEAELQQIARRNFDNFGRYVIDFFKIGRLSPRMLDRLVDMEHVEYLHQCRALEKGIIGLTAHIGNWELGANVLVMNRCRVNAIVRRQPSAKLDRLFQSRRNQRGIRVLPMSGGAQSALGCLRRNELVVVLADLDFSDHVHRALFFGESARLPRGPAVLAARSGAPILPGFVIRQPDDTFRLRFYPPIMPERPRTADDIQKRICSILEDVIGEHPDQWFAFEALWLPGA